MYISKQLPIISRLMLCATALILALAAGAVAEPLSLQALVTPSTVIEKNGHPVKFALHGFIEFKSLAELFPYIDSQTRRWDVPGGLNEDERRRARRRFAAARHRKPCDLDGRRTPAGNPYHAYRRRVTASTGTDQRGSSARLRRLVSGGAGEMEAFVELLECITINFGTSALELVSNRRRHCALRIRPTIQQSISGKR